MTDVPPVRLGMIGCGLIAHAHGLAALRSGNQARFTACMSRTRAGAEAWARSFNIEAAHAYDDLEEMLGRERLQGVVIATWPADHRRHIEICLRHGVRFILCEKALVTRAADAYEIWQQARAAGAVVMEGFMYRHHTAMTQMRERVMAGSLGAIDTIHATFHMLETPKADEGTRSWRQRSEAGGGVPHDFLCYPVDAVGWFAMASPLRATACGARDSRTGTIDRLYGLIEYSNGCVGSVASSRRAVFDQCLEVTGEHGQLRVPVAWTIVGDTEIIEARSPRFIIRSESRTRVDAGSHSDRLIDLPVFALQLGNFARVIAGEAEPVMSLRESVINAFVIEALVKSMSAGCAVPVDIPAEVAAAVRSTPGKPS